MGANNSTRRVSFESDQNENITVVKGIRLSENVINRMRESSDPSKHQPSGAPTPTPSPALRPVPPLFDPITSLPPPPLYVEPVASPSPPPPSATETVAAPPSSPPPPSRDQVAAPTITENVLPSSSPSATANSVTASAFGPVVIPLSPPPPPAADKPVTLPLSLPTPPTPASNAPLIPTPCPAPPVVEVIPPPLIEPSSSPINQPIAPSPPVIKPIAPPHVIESIVPQCVAEPIPPAFEPVTLLSSPPQSSGDTMTPSVSIEPFVAPPLPEFTAPCEPIAPPPQPTMKPASPAPLSEPMAAPKPSPITRPPAAPAVDEEVLRKKITDELHKSLEEERTKADQELQAWLKAEKAQASAKAHAEAQSQVQDEVSRILSVERALAQQSLQQAVIRERIATEDERLHAQLYAKQLEAKEADLRKQDAFYREQVARLEERSAHFYKVTTENYHKAADQVNAKFKRYEVYPVCADLQGQILACYKENVGKTLHCSNIAALYLQCVNNAKQNKLRTGG